MGALQLKETIDERPQPQRMRRAELAQLVLRNKALTELVGGAAKVEEKTKDELLQFLGFQNHLPKTHPLGMEPGAVPYEHWSIDSLRIEAKKRHLDLGWAAKATVEKLIAALKEDDKRVYGPTRLGPVEDEPETDADPAPVA